MFGRIGERGMGRSGWSLSWLAVYCQLLISHTAPANALFNIHLGKFYDSHISICLSAAHTPTPSFTARSPSLFSPPPGVCWDAPRAQHLAVPASRPRGWGGANQSLLGFFLLPCAHLKSASQQGCVVPSPRLPLATPYSPIRGTGPP